MKKLTKALCSLAAVTLLGSTALTVQAASEIEPNNTKGTATKIAVGEKASAKLSDDKDVDWYSFEITKSGYFYLDFGIDKYAEPDQINGGYDLAIYKENDLIYGDEESIKTSESTYKLPYEPGTYYAKVSGSDWYAPEDIAYTVTVHEVESTAWESEPNNNRKNANPLPKDNKKIYATAEYHDGYGDYFSFEISERSMVQITFEYDGNLTEDEIGWGMDLHVYKEGEEKARLDSEDVKLDKTVQVALPAGKYYLHVKPEYGIKSGLEYSVSYSAKPTNVYEKCDRVGSWMTTNEDDGLLFYVDGNDVYCYEKDGTAVVNRFACDGVYTYFFQADRTAMRDRLTYHPDGVHVIYFDSQGHEVFSNFANVKKSIAGDPVDDYCFFDVHGYLYVDVLTWDKAGRELLYANPYGVLERNGWFQFSQYVIWADGTSCDGIAGGYGYGMEDGTLLRDTKYIDWKGAPVYLQGNGVATWDF